MGKVYVQPIQGAWQDDVGKKMHAEANREIEVVNNVAQSMESALKEVDRHRNDNLEYSSQVDELEALQERLERALKI